MLLGLTLTVQAQNKQKFAGYLFAYFEGGGDQNLMAWRPVHSVTGSLMGRSRSPKTGFTR